MLPFHCTGRDGCCHLCEQRRTSSSDLLVAFAMSDEVTTCDGPMSIDGLRSENIGAGAGALARPRPAAIALDCAAPAPLLLAPSAFKSATALCDEEYS